jgi:hypothetical protein
MQRRLYIAERSNGRTSIQAVDEFPIGEDGVTVVTVAGVDPPEELAEQAAKVHFESHPKRLRVCITAVSGRSSWL